MDRILGRMAVLLVCVLAGCDDGLPPPPAAATAPSRPTASRVPVVATVYPLADVARVVGGPYVEVAWWIESGQSPASFEPSPQQLDQLMKAGLVLCSGPGEEFVTRRFATGGFNDRRLIRLDSYVASEQRAARQQWLDPRVVRQAADVLAHHLAVVKPDAADQFRAGAAVAGRQIDALIDDFETRLIGLQGTLIASVGRDYSPLARHVGFRVMSVSDEPAVRMNAEQLRAARKKIADAGAVLLLVEADTPPAVLRNLADLVGVPVVTIDSLGSSSSAGRSTYDELMRYNFNQLYDGWRRAVGG